MKSEEKFIEVFQKAAATVPAYQNVLKKNKINPQFVKNLDDFKKLPVVDKKNYIYANHLKDIFPRGEIPSMVYSSSGSSGKPTFWFRGDEQEASGGELHEVIFNKIFKIKKDEPTLGGICFAV